MNVTRYWLDVDGHPHTEVTEWRQATGDNEAGELLSVASPAFITDPFPPGTYVVLVGVAGAAVDLQGSAPATGYLELPLRAGATVVDEEDFQAAVDADLASAADIENQLADYLADQEPGEVATMIDKIAARAGLTPAEKAILTARLN